MKTITLIKFLREHGIGVSLRNSDLAISYDGHDLPDHIMEELKNNKQEIISFLKEINRGQITDIPVAMPAAHYPLSSSQRRLWILNQLQDAASAYNLVGVSILQGDLHTAALDYSFNALLERHEILRTVFRENEQGEVKQYILNTTETGFRINYYDLREEEQAEEKVKQLVRRQLMQTFDLSSGPLLRVDLYRVSPDRWVLDYVMHHIISDGWSMGVLVKELLSYYNAARQNEQILAIPLRIQYKDYASWQQQQLQDGLLAEHKSWWLEQLAGELPVLELSGDKARPPVKTYNGGVVHKTIGREQLRALRLLAQQHDATLFMAIMTTVNILLYRYSGQEDIIIGSPIAGRDHADLEDQIGFYINTLVLRTQVNREESYLQLLQRIREVTLGAYEHQAYPFDELVDALNLQRDMSRSPLFDVMMVLQNAQMNSHKPQEGLSGLTVSGYQEGGYVISKFDLSFYFTEAEEQLQVGIEYNSDIFHKNTIARLADHFEQLLRSVLGHPVTPIWQLEYITDHEKHRLLSNFNNTVVDYPKDKTVVSLFEEQAARIPDAIALVGQDRSLSYSELNERANQFGNYLREHYQVSPDDLVGIKLERSEWLVITMLAILKAGGAYVPIDPDYPQPRIDYMIEDSRCKLLIDEEELDRFREQQPDYSTDDLPSFVHAENLAYVIYTSGSTGHPKGVMITHGNVNAFIHWCEQEFAHTPFDIAFAATSVCFDLSVFEIFFPLCSGKKLRVLNSVFVMSPYLLAHDNILLNTVPGAIGMLLSEKADLSHVAAINMAGEPIPLRYITELKGQRAEIRNLYGPSEATTYSTIYRIDNDELILIGRPIANTQVYIVDEQQRLCGIGITGEICIGGDGLARGYLHRAELTAEKFIDNPFHPGQRMYRTGDTGRWQEDGNIEFLGRKDDQVKIRGYRIELAEIESTLQQHGAIEAAVVTARGDGNAEKTLVAYLVSEDELNTIELRSWLSQRLPAYMLPAHFVQLQSLPLTPNGKVDKKNLPDPQGLDMNSGQQYVAPLTETQRQLIAVYEDVLKKQPIGLRDDFFVLGGDSIKSIQVVSRLKQRGYSLTIRDVMQYPVVEELATRIKVTAREIDQSTIEGILPLGPIQHWFFTHGDIDLHHYNQSVLLHSRKSLSAEAVQAVLNQLTAHHDALRMVYYQKDGEWIQYNRGLEQGCQLEVMNLTPGQKWEEYCDRLQSEINLAEGPLFKAAIFQGDDGDRLLLIAHHLITDGVSWRILLEDISTLYSQYVEGKPLILPLKTDSFSYWQQQQLNYARSEELRQEANYWDAIEATVISPLPKDEPAGSNLTGDAARSSFVLDHAQTTRLQTQCYRAYHTEINDILLTALGMAIHDLWDTDKLIIGMEGHGREQLGISGDADISRTVGWFTTLYPVVLDMQYTHDMVRQLIEVKERLHRVPGKGIGYGILRYLSGKDYRLEPEITFNYLGDFGSGVQTAGKTAGEELFTFSGQYRGREMSDKWLRHEALGVSGIIKDGKLHISVSYSREQYKTSTIDALADRYRHHLDQLIACLSEEENTVLSPVDLTYQGLSVEQLKKLNSLVK